MTCRLQCAVFLSFLGNLVFYRHVVSINITICTIVVKNGRQPFDYNKSGAAVDIALKKLPGILGPDVNINFIYRDSGPDCVANHVGAIAAELYYNNNVTVFIGTGCSVATEVVARLAASWNLPIITPVSTAGYLRKKDDFSTLTRLSYNMNKFAKFYLSVFRHFDWTDIAIIHETDYIFFRIVGSSLTDEFTLAGKTVYTQSYDVFFPGVHEQLLKRAAEKSRVILLACYGDTLRQIMLTAHSLGMTSGDFVFIYIRLFKGGDNLGDTSWRRNNEMDEKAKLAYQSVLIMQPKRPESREFLQFEAEVKTRAERDYNYVYGEAEVHLFITSFHDAFITYATVLKEMLTAGEDYMNGSLVTSNLWNHTFSGIGGSIVIDETGDREIDFSLLDMDPVSGEYMVVADYLGILRDIVFSNITSLHWPNNRRPPVNRPVCGFTGDDPVCRPPDGISTPALMGIIFACVLIVFAVVASVVYRRMRVESDINSQWWKIRWNDVIMTNTGSVISLDVQSVKTCAGKDTATYKGAVVQLNHLNLKHLKMNRQVLVELKQLRDVSCPNVPRFYGLCLEQPFPIVVTEHCMRGSLRDMLQNETMKLDNDFKMSLIKDIIEGMLYIHTSPIGVHGRLNSDNCRVDSRFVLKLTNFGIPTIRSQEQLGEVANKQEWLWVAPEYLTDSAASSSVSPIGDVYSFAIVCYEMYTRFEPFEEELTTRSIEDVLDQIQSLDSPLRPNLYIEGNLDMEQMVKLCWHQDPGRRPTFSVIRKKYRQFTGSSGTTSIMDALLLRMEQYANNLEDLVEERTRAFLEEKKRSETLLYQVLPKSVAIQLKNGQTVDAESYDSVTIYFSDIVGFTFISADSTAMQVVELLNDIYTCFDEIIEHYDVYKVETIGDSYMVVSGLPIRNGQEHAREIARMSLSILENIRQLKIRHLPDRPLKVRIGLHTGPCCAGVVGRKMPRYCLFGDTVNTASRMESHGQEMSIHISESSMFVLQRWETFIMEPRGAIPIKGKGVMTTYWLHGEVEPLSDHLLPL